MKHSTVCATESVNIDIEDFDQLHRYLVAQGHVSSTEVVDFKLLAGGVSSRTVLVNVPPARSWVLKQSLPKLRVQLDWFSDPRRVHREALGLRWLAKLAPSDHFAQFVFEDFDQHLFAMSAVQTPHRNWKSMLLEGEIHQQHVAQFGKLLGTIHGQAWRHRLEVEPLFRDQQFFESLRIEPYYRCSAERVPEAGDFLRKLVALTDTRRLTIVHGDYSPKNVLVSGDTLVLLDHEVIHFGDPAFDLGFALTHFLSKAHHLPHARDRFLAACLTFWNAYFAELVAVPWLEQLEAVAVLHTLGCMIARTSGRSPLEYLSADERTRQQQAVIALMRSPPSQIAQLAVDVDSLLDGR